MGGSMHSESGHTTPSGSPPRAAPVMAELVEQAAAMSLRRGSFGSPRPGQQRSSFGSPGPSQQQQQQPGGFATSSAAQQAGVFGSPGAGRSGLGGGDGSSALSATAAAFSSAPAADVGVDAVLRSMPSSSALTAGQHGSAAAFGAGFGQLDLGGPAPSPMHSFDSNFSTASGLSGLDTRADWDHHLGAGGYNQFGSSNSQTPSVASVASSFSSIASYDVGMGGRGGYGNGYASQGGGYGAAAGSNFLGQSSGGYAVTGYTSLPPPGQQAAPPPPPQPPAAPPQLPSNPTSPFLQYSFAQPSVGFYTGQNSMAAPQTAVRPGGGDLGAAPPGGGGAAGSRPGSGAWPPADISLNLNKAITKRLANATHYQQLLDIISDSAMYFDEVNVATALHRLARLHCTSASSNAATIIVTSDQFRLLLAAIRKLLPRFEAQAVSNTAWALATLVYLPEGDLLTELAVRATAIIRTFRPQATSNTLWAYAKLGMMPPESFMVAAAQQMLHDMARSVPQDISNMLWAYATLRYSPGAQLLNGAAAHAVYCMPRFKPQEVANTLWSYATLGHDPGAQLLDAIAAHMCDRMHVFRPQAISNSLWAYAKLQYNPGRELLEAAGRRALAALHQYTPQELGNTLWAFAVLEHHPGAPLLDAAAAHILGRQEHFGPADTSNSLWAYARLFHYPGPELLQAVGLHAMRHWHRFRAAEVANLVWALAILKAPSPELWAGILEKLAHAPVASFDDADLHQIFQSYLLLDQQIKRAGAVAPAGAFPHELLEEAEARWKAAVRAPPHASQLQEAVSKTLWRMGISHSTQHLTSDGMFCVDIALDGEQVFIEVDPPSHFSTNSHRPLGRTVGRRCMLEARGYTVRSIAYYEWATLESDALQQAYLTRLLASCF